MPGRYQSLSHPPRLGRRETPEGVPLTPSTTRRLLRAVSVSICLALTALAGAASPSAAATKTCNAAKTKYPNASPGGYFTSLKVTNVSCSSGAKLMVAYYKCRRAHGQGLQG